MGSGRFELPSREPKSRSPNVNWPDFEKWLLNDHQPNTVDLILRYSRRYWTLLEDSDATRILCGLSKDKRRNVMAALANLSRFLGCYKAWNVIIEEAGVHWGKRSSLETVIDILNEDLHETETWLNKAVSCLPETYRTTLIFQSLTGLRPSEACVSCSLISTRGLDGYFNADLQMLEHFKFPDLFLRRSKNAYISFVPIDVLDQIVQIKPTVEKTAIKSALRHRGLPNRMMELRKLYATTLREKGIPQEVIDLLQGRVSQSIFLRHYYKPYLVQVRDKVFEALQDIRSKAGLN